MAMKYMENCSNILKSEKSLFLWIFSHKLIIKNYFRQFSYFSNLFYKILFLSFLIKKRQLNINNSFINNIIIILFKVNIVIIYLID